MKKILSITILLGCLFALGCNRPAKHAKEFLSYITALSGDHCLASAIGGCALRTKDLLVVEESAENGEDRVVLKYRDNGEWVYRGIDLSKEMIDAFYGLNDTAKKTFFENVFSDGEANYGELFFEPGDQEYFYYNSYNELTLFSEELGTAKDLELMGARVEDNNAVKLGEKLAIQYGLSEERGQEVARTISVYNKLTTKRALTANEKDQFSYSLLGVDYKTANRGVTGGDSYEFDALMEQAAETNGTTPEAMAEIIREMVL